MWLLGIVLLLHISINICASLIDQHPLDIDRTGLQKKYPAIGGVFDTSATITEQVNIMPHIHELLPETWFTGKTKLEGLGTNPISSHTTNTLNCVPKTK